MSMVLIDVDDAEKACWLCRRSTMERKIIDALKKMTSSTVEMMSIIELKPKLSQYDVARFGDNRIAVMINTKSRRRYQRYQQ